MSCSSQEDRVLVYVARPRNVNNQGARGLCRPVITSPTRPRGTALACASGWYLVFFCAWSFSGQNLCAAEPRRLTDDGKLKLAPVFANSQEIVFATHEVPNLVALIRLNVMSGSRERLHPAVTAHQFDAAFSPDGRYHAYAMSSTSPQLVLVIQDLKDKQEFTFRPRDSRATVRGPSFAPDNSRVVFSLSDLGGHQIASVNLRGQDLRRLTESAGANISPAFSPDGSKIAFSSSRDGDFDIYVMDADGNNVRRLTKSPGLDVRPAWSPDGKRIAFTSNRDGNYEIYVMNADGSGLRRVTDYPGKDDFAAWHPDGKHLVIVSERQGKSDLYLVEAPD
jgi:TolB protein